MPSYSDHSRFTKRDRTSTLACSSARATWPALAVVVAAHRAGLVQAPPTGPVQHRLRRGQDAHDQAIDEPADFGDRERDQGVAGGELRHQRPPFAPAPGSRERTTAR
jgi:hypothetical protein